jgi:hypothetical protein
MNTCNPTCVTDIPNADWTKDCSIGTRVGGIPFLTFFKCDPDINFPVDTGELSPWTSLDNWRYAICNGLMFVTGELLGQKPKGTFTKRRITSCSPEVVVSGSKTITFQDFNSSPDDLIDFDFWSGINESKRYLQFGWISCDDLSYQTAKNWDLDVDQVIEDNSQEGLSFYEGEVTINEPNIIKPIKVPGLYDLISNFTTETECYG